MAGIGPPRQDPAQAACTVASYLLNRLKALGVDHLFGVPGDYSMGFLNQVLLSPVEYVGTCNELNAAYAADGYARIRGLGALCTTYGVGELSAINGVAGAFAEQVPVVTITGAPATADFKAGTLRHHTLGDYRTPLRMYERITAASALLDSAAEAPAKIDHVLAECLRQGRPAYFCLPADLAGAPCAAPGLWIPPARSASDPAALSDAVAEAVAMLDPERFPVLIGGMGLLRHRLQKEFAALIEKSGIPYCTMMLGKSLLSEHNPRYLGLFEGHQSRPDIRGRIASAGCVLTLGALMSDLNTGGFTADLDPVRTIQADMDSVHFARHSFNKVALGDFVAALTAELPRREPPAPDLPSAHEIQGRGSGGVFVPVAGKALSLERFFEHMGRHIKDGAMVLADTGVSLFCAAELLLPSGASFIGQAFYGSIGYSLGAALGACVAAPDRQALLFIGDGAFQMTCQELSTIIGRGLRPLIFIISNDGYTIERSICDRSYNDIRAWHYRALMEAFGGGRAWEVSTEDGLVEALSEAAGLAGPALFEIHAGRMEAPPALWSAGKAMAKANFLDV